MTVARMKKVTLLGQSRRKDVALAWLQELGCMQLVGDRRPGRDESAPTPGTKRHHEALRYLVDCPSKRRTLGEDHAVDMEALVDEILHSRQRRRDVGDELDELYALVSQLEPWGDFVVPPNSELEGRRLWFYAVPHHRMDEVRNSGVVWEKVNQDTRTSYVVVVAPEEPAPGTMPVARFDPPATPLEKLRLRLRTKELDLDAVRSERRELTRWLPVLVYQMLELDNRAMLTDAAAHLTDDGHLFVLRGWVPASFVGALEEFCVTLGVACSVEEPRRTESPPVLLQNQGPLAAGEELVKFFQLPGYDDWDPSAIVLASFALFSAMIFSDAGYAVLFGAAVTLFHKSLGRSPYGVRIRTIGYYVAGASLVYGVVVGSYFGTVPPPGSLPGKLHLLDVHDFDSMMGLSVVVGCIHLVLANAMTAHRRWPSQTAVAPLGWIVIVISGLLALAGATLELAPPLRTAAWLGLAVGAIAVLLFSSDEAPTSLRGVAWRLFEGLKGVSGITTAFGDILSYLRLFALGLASASLAVTFNELAGRMLSSFPGVGVLAAIMIVVIGHGVNLALCVLGGIVHGLRLNLIEFYHWSIYGEGSPFRAFRKKETVSWTS